MRDLQRNDTRAKRSKKAPRRSQSTERRELLLARLQLGEFIRARREEIKLSVTEVAKHAGWNNRQDLHNIENAKTLSHNISAWIKLADVLNLNPKFVLGKVWDTTKNGLEIPLPPEGDGRRDVILQFAIERFADDSAHEIY